MADNQPGDEMPDGMPEWPGGDAEIEEEGEDREIDSTGVIQAVVNRLYPSPDGSPQVVSDWVLTVEVMTADGNRGIQLIAGPDTPYWRAMGLVEAHRVALMEHSGMSDYCEGHEDE